MRLVQAWLVLMGLGFVGSLVYGLFRQLYFSNAPHKLEVIGVGVVLIVLVVATSVWIVRRMVRGGRAVATSAVTVLLVWIPVVFLFAVGPLSQWIGLWGSVVLWPVVSVPALIFALRKNQGPTPFPRFRQGGVEHE